MPWKRKRKRTGHGGKWKEIKGSTHGKRGGSDKETECQMGKGSHNSDVEDEEDMERNGRQKKERGKGKGNGQGIRPKRVTGTEKEWEKERTRKGTRQSEGNKSGNGKRACRLEREWEGRKQREGDPTSLSGSCLSRPWEALPVWTLSFCSPSVWTYLPGPCPSGSYLYGL